MKSLYPAFLKRHCFRIISTVSASLYIQRIAIIVSSKKKKKIKPFNRGFWYTLNYVVFFLYSWSIFFKRVLSKQGSNYYGLLFKYVLN